MSPSVIETVLADAGVPIVRKLNSEGNINPRVMLSMWDTFPKSKENNRITNQNILLSYPPRMYCNSGHGCFKKIGYLRV